MLMGRDAKVAFWRATLDQLHMRGLDNAGNMERSVAGIEVLTESI